MRVKQILHAFLKNEIKKILFVSRYIYQYISNGAVFSCILFCDFTGMW